MKLRSIILVDDDDDEHFLLQSAMDELGSSTHLMSARSCQEMITLLKREVKAVCELIIMDINLPGENGFDCLRILKADHDLREIPVVIFSTCSDEDTIDEAFRSGAIHFVPKPWSFEQLKRIVEMLTSLDLRRVRNPVLKEDFIFRTS